MLVRAFRVKQAAIIFDICRLLSHLSDGRSCAGDLLSAKLTPLYDMVEQGRLISRLRFIELNMIEVQLQIVCFQGVLQV